MVRDRRSAGTVALLVACASLAASVATFASAAPAEAQASAPSIDGSFLVGFDGAPQDPAYGILGQTTPEQAAVALNRKAGEYRAAGLQVVPVFHLNATLAQNRPGGHGLYRTRQPAATIQHYLDAVRSIGGILVLDIQPGRSTFIRETRHLRTFIAEPDVGVALDPEWNVGPHGIPGKRIGSVGARDVNRVSALIEGIAAARGLPRKIMIVHEFRRKMIRSRGAIRNRPHVAAAINYDGSEESPDVKASHYQALLPANDTFRRGIEVFLGLDQPPFTNQQVLAVRPSVSLVIYQ